MTIQKLIAEYQAKIADCDKHIARLAHGIRIARAAKEQEDVVADLANERYVYDAQRQAYVQIVQDLQSIN